jgi:hypothetical protein
MKPDQDSNDSGKPPEKPSQPAPANTTPTGIRQKLTPDELLMVQGWEKAHQRTMTDQQIRFAIAEWNATIGEI